MNHLKKLAQTALLFSLSVAFSSQAEDLPGKGITVQPVQSTIAEEAFQTILINKAMEKLGYTVKPIKQVDYNVAYASVAGNDATYLGVGWSPLQDGKYKKAGGDAKFFKEGVYISGAAQGYLIDKKTADKYKITNIAQLKDPKIAALFDHNGNGKADLTGCNPGWGCETVIEHQLSAFGLRDTVEHNQGSYSALMADTITRYKKGEPILYYTWTPYWVSGELVPGKDTVWLEVPFSSLPGDRKDLDTKLPNGKNYGFPVNTMKIIANKEFAKENPAAAKLFSIMHVSVNDISAQNKMMQAGKSTPEQVDAQANGWIKAHQALFDSWINEAKAAAKTSK